MTISNIADSSKLPGYDSGLLFARRSGLLRIERDHLTTTRITFLHAWKTAVSLAGTSFFGDGTQASLESAAATRELLPNLERISESLNRMSPDARAFIAALVSLHDCPAASRLLLRTGVSGLAELGALDLQRRSVIASLMLHYSRF